MTGIRASARAYEGWLRARLGPFFVAADLREKHKLMREDLFSFLRATCWRWAETAHEICPELAGAPAVASVGDAHVANFGLWRDSEGRLVWGVNDYDEAAVTPWPFDLVRLGASALVAEDAGRRASREIEAALLDGYAKGLAAPRPFILEQDHLWLRDLFATTEKGRSEYWEKLISAKPPREPVPKPFIAALLRALPRPRPEVEFAPRRAGVGSLGRMRQVALAEDHRGGPLAREAKALVPSCWHRDGRAGEQFWLASGAYRSPDPWLRLDGAIVVRRLAPNSRKLELGDHRRRVRRRLLEAMAFDIASVHAADAKRIGAVRENFERRESGWLRTAARAVAEATARDWKAWRAR